MNKNLNEKLLAKRIGSVIADVLMFVGVVLFCFSIIEQANEKYYTFEPSYSEYEVHILMMMKYGLAMGIAGIILSIIFSISIGRLENDEIASDAIKKSLEKMPASLGEEVEFLNIDDIEKLAALAQKKQATESAKEEASQDENSPFPPVK